MAYKVRYSETAQRELQKLDRQVSARIIKALERLQDLADPRTVGEALHGDLKGSWKYRVGEWRVIAKIQDGTLIVYVVKIGHRKEIY